MEEDKILEQEKPEEPVAGDVEATTTHPATQPESKGKTVWAMKGWLLAFLKKKAPLPGETLKESKWQAKAKKILRANNRMMEAVIGLVVLILILVGITSLTGGGSARGNGAAPVKMTAELKEAAKERTTLTVGIPSTGLPPFIYQNYDGDYTGTDYDLMKNVCAQYGWTLQISVIDWSERNSILKAGVVDCLWGGFNSFGRESDYAWTAPYEDSSDVVVVLKSNKDINTLDDLKEKTVAAITGSQASTELEGLGLAMKRLECQDAESCLSYLKDGTANAAVMTSEAAQSLGGVRVLDDNLETKQYAVACATENTQLRDLIQYALNQE